jgi:hypothetical protein
MWLSAGFDIVVSIVLLVVSFITPDLLPTFGIPVPNSIVWIQTVFLLIINEGIGYLIVSIDISKNHGLVIIGGLSRTISFIWLVFYYFLGEIGFTVVLVSIIDIIFVCFYIEFLINWEKAFKI